jgi:hypothetical protein
MERQEPWISAHKGTGRKGGREPPMGEGPQDDAPPPILEGDPGSAPAEHWSKNGRFCTMARQERYKKDRILLAKSAGFGPAAALSGFQSGGPPMSLRSQPLPPVPDDTARINPASRVTRF